MCSCAVRFAAVLRATSFFVKADPELQRMVKDFYDSGFSESSADDRPEMSQEELRFLRELQSTVVLKDGHQHEDSTQVRNGMANLASSKVGMAIIVPIKVWSRTARTPVIT